MSIICIAGMHRSGTSMIARLLNLCGLYLGEAGDLLNPKPDNPEGYWENIKFLQINEAILSHLRGGWDLPPIMETGWEKAPELAPIQTQAQELLRQFEGHEPWGWKDPRNSLTLPFWLRLIPDLKVIICVRHPLEVAQSLERRGYSSKAFGFNLWTVYNQRLIASIPAEKRLITHYETYFRYPRAELIRLLEYAGLSTDEGTLQQALASITGSLRHNQASLEDLASVGAPPETIELYTALCAQAGPFFRQALMAATEVQVAPGKEAAPIHPGSSSPTPLPPSAPKPPFQETRVEWPPEVVAALQRADQCVAQQDFENARMALLEAQRLQPEDPWLMVALGNVLVQLEQFEAACLEFVKAITTQPTYLQGYTSLAATLLRLGKVDEARQLLNQALELQPGNREAVELLRALLEADSQMEAKAAPIPTSSGSNEQPIAQTRGSGKTGQVQSKAARRNGRRSKPYDQPNRLDFTLYTSSRGNYFFGEIRDLLAAGLRELGYRVGIGDESHGFSVGSAWHIVIAPHEFFYLGAGADLRRGKLPANLILVNTEQPSTQWFALSASLFPRATHIWDINDDSAEQIREKGFEVQVLRLGYVSGFPLYREVKELPQHQGTCFLEAHIRRHSYLNLPLAQRPIDLLFIGGLTSRREAFFARSARVFSQYRAYFHLADGRRPVIPGLSTYMNTETVVGLAQRSKLFLNIHRDRDKYFEWHRVVMLGIWQKTLVVSESSRPAPPFVPNVDYVETSLQEMPERVEYYLASLQGQREAQEIADHGYQTLTQQCRLADTLRPLLGQIVL